MGGFGVKTPWCRGGTCLSKISPGKYWIDQMVSVNRHQRLFVNFTVKPSPKADGATTPATHQCHETNISTPPGPLVWLPCPGAAHVSIRRPPVMSGNRHTQRCQQLHTQGVGKPTPSASQGTWHRRCGRTLHPMLSRTPTTKVDRTAP